jgi:hypothetical protein
MNSTSSRRRRRRRMRKSSSGRGAIIGSSTPVLVGIRRHGSMMFYITI